MSIGGTPVHLPGGFPLDDIVGRLRDVPGVAAVTAIPPGSKYFCGPVAGAGSCAAAMCSGNSRRVAVAMQMSRSVTMPTTCPAASTTGITPQSRSHIKWATAAKSVCGWQVSGGPDITSRASMA